MPRPESLRLKLTGDGLSGRAYRLELDGTDVSATVTGVTVTLDVAEVNRAEIRYKCVRVEVDGEFNVVHQCGLGEDE